MASFYDTVDYSDLKRVEALLKKGGIEYTMRVMGSKDANMKEIMVAEEDLPAAEDVLSGKFYPNN